MSWYFLTLILKVEESDYNDNGEDLEELDYDENDEEESEEMETSNEFF
jgi:hypothetical protein